MTRNDERSDAAPREGTCARALIGTAIGLCLAIRPAVSQQALETHEIQQFTAHPTLGAMRLTWTVPPASTFTRLMIRYRVDGQPPSSPSDGFPLFDAATPAGAMYATHHSGLSPRHRYAYAAFAIDDAGVVRETQTALGVPLATQPPGTVQNLRRVDLQGAACGPAAEARP